VTRSVAAQETVTDPIGVVVRLITGLETSLNETTLTRVVTQVARGRAQRRRLATALVAQPSVLTDGRSPAPRVTGDLLIALRNAGAHGIAAPRCAECGKDLRTLQQRGGHWYCSVCASRLSPMSCASCGLSRPTASLDRQGQPRCDRCPDRDDRDPLTELAELICRLDPALSTQTAATAVRRVFSRSANIQHLAWVLTDQPGLLTGDGAQAPMPAVLRLINELCDAGAKAIIRPACSRCHRIVRLDRRLEGNWTCRNCVAKAKAVSCARCGALREPATRDAEGQPLCPNCLSIDPANQEVCISCSRRRPVSNRTAEGPVCPSCRPKTVLTCAICDRTAVCQISKVTGQPWCHTCQQRREACTQCGEVKQVRAGTQAAPLCASCAHPDPSFWRSCRFCGRTGQLNTGACSRCALDQRLKMLLDDGTGRTPTGLQELRLALASTERPATAMAWLSKNIVSTTLTEFATGARPLTHHGLDELPRSKPGDHLRSVLVATGVLPERDEHFARLERWTTQTLNERSNLEQKELLHRYAIWHLLRRLRSRNRDRNTTQGQVTVVRQHVRAAIVLLDWLAIHGLTLATCGQGDLEDWLTSKDLSHRAEAGHFVRWAISQHVNRDLQFAATRWTGPTGPLDPEERWHQAKRLLHDETLDTGDRVAGLLLVLYAQRPAVISRLSIDDVITSNGAIRLRLGPTPVVLPEPLANLTQSLVANRHGRAVLGDQGTSPWLFPGGQPGRPISADRLGHRLRLIGIRPAQARSTAMFQLASELPAAILARMLGIHIKVAVQWQQASAGDWTAYAADISRRNRPKHQAFRQLQ
jgi:hypothetical protein